VLTELSISRGNSKKLDSLSTQEIVAASSRAIAHLIPPAPSTGGVPSFRGPIPGWSPTRDGRIIPQHPCDPMSPAISAHIPIIVGTNQHEFVNGVDNPEVDSLTQGDLLGRLKAIHADNAFTILDTYKRIHPESSAFDLWADISASGPRSSAYTQALRKSALRQAPAYAYVYAWRTPVLGGKLGTFHSAEITMVFNNATYCDRYTGGGEESLALSRNMSAAWAALAKNGSPQHDGLPQWPAYEDATKSSMMFDTECSVKRDFEGEGLALLQA
jgi:para-nitrobenzyl esterase